MVMERYNLVNHLFLSFLKNSNNVLDLGCGVGEYLVSAVDKKRLVIGADLDKFQLKNKICNFISVQCDALHLPFVHNSFDLILFSEVLEHLPHPEKALDEIVRVLKPKGILLLSTPSKKSFYEKQYLVFAILFLIKIFQKLLCRRVLENVGHISLQLPNDVNNMLRKRKLKILSEHYVGFCLPFTGELLNFLFKFKPIVRVYSKLDRSIGKSRKLAHLCWSMIFVCQK